jgi:predicted porin
MYSLDFLNLTTVDPFATGLAGDTQNIIGDKGTSRLNNTVQYTTPSIGGFTASAELSLGEQTGNWEGGRETGAAVTYTRGPLYASFTFLDMANTNGIGASRKDYMFGATYDFGVVKLHGLAMKASGDPTGAARPLDTLDLLAGVTVPVAGGNVLASYINHNDRTALSAKGGGDRDANQWALGYVYPLSKRTSLYTSYARIQNEHGAVFTVGNATEAGIGSKSFDIGCVHNF